MINGPIVSPDELTPLVGWLRDNGALGALVVFVAGILRGWWVTSREYAKLVEDARQLQVDRDHWRRMSLETGSVAAAALDLSHIHISQPTRLTRITSSLLCLK
mgnify:CR=1 FL=1